MYGVGTSWVHNSFLAIGDISSEVSILVTALFVLASAVIFMGVVAIIQAIWVRLPRFVQTGEKAYTLSFSVSKESRRYSALGTALGWIVFEFLNTLVVSDIAFPWLQAGYAFIDTWLVGLATVGGVALVSFFVLVTAIALYRIQRIRIFTMVLALVPWLLGIGLINVPWTQPIEEKQIVLVQSNLSIADKLAADGFTQSWRTQTRLSMEEVGADFVIWPEGALPTTLSSEVKDSLYTLAAHTRASMIVGMFGESMSENYEVVLHNIAVGVSKFAPEYEEYKKLKMAPFGEKIPFEPILGPIVRWLDIPIRSIDSGIEAQGQHGSGWCECRSNNLL